MPAALATPTRPLLSGDRDRDGRHDADPEAARPDGFHRRGRVPRLLQVARLRGRGENPGQVFLKLTSAQTLAFGGAGDQAKSDALGALATPQMSLLGLSKILGPVSGNDATDAAQVETALGTVQGDNFDPTQFFKDATMLGGIKLGEILPVAMSLAGADVPKLLARDFPDRVEARFDWSGEITKSDQLKLLIPAPTRPSRPRASR